MKQNANGAPNARGHIDVDMLIVGPHLRKKYKSCDFQAF